MIRIAEIGHDEKITKETALFFSSEGPGWKPFTPQHVGPNVSLAFMRMLRKDGNLAAIAYLLEEVMGPEAMDVLTADPTLTNAQISQLGRLVESAVVGMGPLDPTGPSDSPEPSSATPGS